MTFPRKRTVNRLSGFEKLEDRRLLFVNIEFNYDYDVIDKTGRGWFDDPSRRSVLEAAGATIGSMLEDVLLETDAANYSAVTGEDVSWSVGVKNPSRYALGEVSEKSCSKRIFGVCTDETYNTRTELISAPSGIHLANPILKTNTIVIFVGVGRQKPGALASATTATIRSRGGGAAWTERVVSRGQSGAWGNGDELTDISPSFGSISFDSEANWHLGFDNPPREDQSFSLLSLAMHEIGHILGLGSSPVWSNNRRQIGDEIFFVGPNAVAANGGNPVPVEPDSGHLKSSLSGIFNESQWSGVTDVPSQLDLAVLKDLGWEINSETGFISKNVFGRVTDAAGNGVGGVTIFASCEEKPGGCPLTLAPIIAGATDADGNWPRAGVKYDDGEVWSTGVWRLVAMYDGEELETTKIERQGGVIQSVDFELDRIVSQTSARLYRSSANDAYLSTEGATKFRVTPQGKETELQWLDRYGVYSKKIRNPSDIKIDLNLDSNRVSIGTPEGFFSPDFTSGSSVTIQGARLREHAKRDRILVTSYGYSQDFTGVTSFGEVIKKLTIVVDASGAVSIPRLRLNAFDMEQIQVLAEIEELEIFLSSPGVHTLAVGKGENGIFDLGIQLDEHFSIETYFAPKKIAFRSEVGEFDIAVTQPLSAISIHNEEFPNDVSGDGIVSPIDALHVINFLNQVTDESQLERAKFSAYLMNTSVDVTNDGIVSPLDVLKVINFLNTGNPEGEGMGVFPVMMGNPTQQPLRFDIYQEELLEERYSSLSYQNMLNVSLSQLQLSQEATSSNDDPSSIALNERQGTSSHLDNTDRALLDDKILETWDFLSDSHVTLSQTFWS